MYQVFNEDGVVAVVPAFDTQAQGSKIDLTSELWNPAGDVVNGNMTAEDWADSIENAFAQGPFRAGCRKVNFTRGLYECSARNNQIDAAIQSGLEGGALDRCHL